MADQSETPQIDTEQIKQEAIQAAKDALVSSLQGTKPKYSWEEQGKSAPSNYDELFSEVKRITPTLTEDEVRAKAREEFEKLEAERETKKQQQEQEKQQLQVKNLEDQRKKFDSEWYELVQDGKMPAVASEVQEKINKGEKLTKEEIMADEGLKARWDLAQLAASKTKSAKLAFYEDYGKEPAGKLAPVLGGRPSTPQTESTELTYDEVVKNRKKAFGF